MPEWKNYTIGELCDTISEKYKRNDDEVILINTSDVLEGKILNHEKVKNENLKGQFKKTFKKDDILFSEIRPANKRFAYVDFSSTEQYIASTKLMVLRTKKEIILPRYLFYILKSDSMLEKLQHLAETRSGTFPQITFSGELSNLEVIIPDFETQLKILRILDSIEYKIEINEKINNNLLEQADSIFKSWFIDFEPFNNEFPNDWNNGTIEDLSEEIICGKTPSTKKKEYYGNDIPFITIPDMHNSTYIIKTERYLSVLGADSQPKKTLPKNSICVSCIGTAGLVSLVSIDSQTNQQINSIIPKKNISPYYIYLLMRGKYDEINKYGQGGSTIVNLNKREFSKLEVTIPSNDVLLKFDKIVKHMFEVILNNQNENEKLSNLRDYLLPNLINGIMDVSQIDI